MNPSANVRLLESRKRSCECSLFRSSLREASSMDSFRTSRGLTRRQPRSSLATENGGVRMRLPRRALGRVPDDQSTGHALGAEEASTQAAGAPSGPQLGASRDTNTTPESRGKASKSDDTTRHNKEWWA